MNLGVKQGASATVIRKAALEAEEMFERQVRRLDSSDVNVTTKLATDNEARAILRSLNLTERVFDPARIGITENEDIHDGNRPARFGININIDGVELTDEQRHEFLTTYAQVLLEDAEKNIDAMESVDPRVKKRALEMLGKPGRKGPRFLSELWGPYCKRQGWDMAAKSGKEKQANWDRAMNAIGDHMLVNATDDEINRGFREIIDEVADRGLKPHTATRYLSDVRACFMDAASRHDLKWYIRSNSSRKQNKTQKVITETASEKQMTAIAKACIARNDVHGVVGLMWLHGVSPEEIAAISDADTIMERLPHIIIMDGKTKDRPRVVCPVLGVKVIRKHLEATIELCQQRVDPGANFNKWIKTMKGMEGITGRSLRHGVRNAFVMTGQNNGIMKSALGWSGGDQTLAMHYGASGVGQSEFVKALQKAFKEAHAATIKALA
ncbi:MAG: hypothetical protein P8O03_14105 [Ilumatobacter sp.]|nr:hypothetical protein [Ilumatobacter sp.]